MPCENHAAIQAAQLEQARELGGIQATLKSVLNGQDALFENHKELRDAILSLKLSSQTNSDKLQQLVALYGNGWKAQFEVKFQDAKENIETLCAEVKEYHEKTDRHLNTLDRASWFGFIIADFKEKWARRIAQGAIALVVLQLMFSFTGYVGKSIVTMVTPTAITRTVGK